jgi:hypothetical protein
MNYIFYAILVYLLYRFITGFVLPVAKATSQVKKQFNAMHQHAEAQQSNNQSYNRSTVNGVDQKPKYDVEGEYIKFEEIKD